MMSSTLFQYIVLLSICAAIGLVIDWGEVRIRGKARTIPYIGRSARNTTIAAVVLILVAVSSSINSLENERRNTECFRQFFAALQYNQDVSEQQARLTAEAERYNTERHSVIDNVFLELSRGVDTGEFLQLAADYNARTGKANAEIDRVTRERDQLEKSRKPYPAPTCGNG